MVRPSRIPVFIQALIVCALGFTSIVKSEYLQESSVDTKRPKQTNKEEHIDNLSRDNTYSIGAMELDISRQPMSLKAKDKNGRKILKAHLGTDLPDYTGKLVTQSEDGTKLSIQIPKTADLSLNLYEFKNSDCIDISWRALSCVTEHPTDCIRFENDHWYGGPELKPQLWPLEKVDHQMAPYMGQDIMANEDYGPVQERLFFSSSGVGIYIPEDVPLFVSINNTGDNSLCLQARYDNYFYTSINNTLPELDYTVCTAPNVKSIYELMTEKYIQKPSAMVNPDLFRYPIWSTWAEYKTNISQTDVIDFVSSIKKNNLSISQIEIDDDWTVKYGDLEFNNATFPDPKGLVDSMHSQNISVTLWVHPFVNIDAMAFNYLASRGWMIQDVSGRRPALTSWWNGNMAGHIDFSNPDASEWYLAELNTLKSLYNMDSFKFDAGDVNYLPPMFKAREAFLNKNHYTRLYAIAGHQSDTVQNRIEVRTGTRTQNLPVMVRMLDRLSTWGLDEGLKSVITTSLLFGIIGYPFVLPDLIGGNMYHNNLDAELFIRWIQANALMPIMQFSLAPWNAKNSTVLEVAQDMVKLHAKYSDLIIQLANQSVTTGYPIMRPLWWIAPTDVAALTVDDQFLLGDDLLVAPVVEQGQTIRRLYLPAGRWRDEIKGQTYDGGKWIDFPVTLRDLPYFSKMSS